MHSTKQKKMVASSLSAAVTAIIIAEDGELSQIKITDEHALYKKIGLNHPGNFKCQGSMKINKIYSIILYAKPASITKRVSVVNGGENKYKFPAPFNNSAYKGSCILLQHRNDKLADLTIDMWNEICNKKSATSAEENSDDDDDDDRDNDSGILSDNDSNDDDDEDENDDIKTRYSASYSKKYKKKNDDDDLEDDPEDDPEDAEDEEDADKIFDYSQVTVDVIKNKITTSAVAGFAVAGLNEKEETKEEPYMYTSELVEEEYV